MIQIESYSRINDVSFGSSEDGFVTHFGEPIKRRVNHENEKELHYRDFIARFDAKTGMFREFTLLPECDARINDIQVEWQPAFLSTIQYIDPGLVEVLGFVLSLKLGLAFSGFHDNDLAQMAIHAFQQGDWDHFRHRMKPFHFKN